MKEIMILLTKYSDWISSMVYHFCGKGYTHVSIALEDEPETYYSFNYRGFAIETLEKHRRRGVNYSRCYRIQIPDRYTRFGVLCCALHIPLHWKRHYFCSQFVAELLEHSGAVALTKSSSLFLPNHFIALMEAQSCCQIIDNII